MFDDSRCGWLIEKRKNEIHKMKNTHTHTNTNNIANELKNTKHKTFNRILFNDIQT